MAGGQRQRGKNGQRCSDRTQPQTVDNVAVGRSPACVRPQNADRRSAPRSAHAAELVKHDPTRHALRSRTQVKVGGHWASRWNGAARSRSSMPPAIPLDMAVEQPGITHQQQRDAVADMNAGQTWYFSNNPPKQEIAVDQGEGQGARRWSSAGAYSSKIGDIALTGATHGRAVHIRLAR